MAKIKFRRDTAAAWIDANPVLAQGEPGFEHDTGKLKIGDGSSTWTELDYANPDIDIPEGDSLTDDRAVTITVGNTEYFAIVNRANNDDDGVKSSGVAYDSEGNMIALHVSELDNGDDEIDRLIISKFDNVGNLLWQKQIQEDVDTEPNHDILIDEDDNIIVAVSDDRPGADVLVLIKMDPDGVVLWQKEYLADVETEITEIVELQSNVVTEATVEGNTVDVVTVYYDFSSPFNWDLQESADAGQTWTTLGTSVGNSYDNNTNTTQYYFADGSITASLDYPTKIYRLRRDGVNSDLEVTAIALSGTAIVVAAEYRENNNGPSDQGFLMKVSSTGALQWARTFDIDEAETTPYGMDVGANGDVVVVGVAFPGGGPNAGFAAKFDGDTGEPVWTSILFGPANGNENEYTGGDVVVDSQNNIFITINSYQPIVHEDGNSLNVTVSHVMKLNIAGVTQWCRRIGPGPCASVATGIDCDDQGNVYLAALTLVQKNPVRDLDEFFNNTAKNVLAVAKYSTTGAVLWQRYIESDHYYFYPDSGWNGPPGQFDATTSRGRNMSIGPNGKLAIQISAFMRDPDDYQENDNYWESITFQIDQDGREMTVGSGNELFRVRASRIPGKFITLEGFLFEGIPSSDFTEDVTVSTATLTFGDAELAQQVARSAPYEYVFGNDGTLTIPNDGDLKLVQTQIGWFSIFGPANNDNDDIWIRANCVDPSTGDVYVVGQEDDNGQGFVARYNSQGEILWSIRLYDDNNGYNTRCNAVKIHPTNGNVVVLCEYFGNETGVLLVQIDPDTARVETSVGFRDQGENGGTNAYDFAFLTDGDVVVVGRKYDEWRVVPVTPQEGSTTNTLVINKSELGDLTPNEYGSWYVSGSGITGRGTINSVVGDETTWTITTNDAVDFSGEGSWNLEYELGGEAFVAVAGGLEFSIDWTKVLSAGGIYDTERYFSVAVDGSNNIYAAGEMIARNDAAGSDLNSYWCAVVSKFSSDGTHLWTKALNDSLNDCYAKSVAVQGNAVVVTHENSNNGITVVTKLDGTGTIKWQRRTYTGDDSSVAIDTNSDVYVVAETYMESQYGNCVKVIRFNSTGEIIWRKILATQLIGSDNTSEYFKNGRNLTLDADNLYISGYTTAYDDNYENGFLAKIPKSGDQDGVYSVWVIQNDTYDVDKINSTEATAFTPVIGQGEWELWEPDFESQWWDPSNDGYYHTLTEMRDRDGGAIEFADGTRQTSSAQQIPQIKIANGADHRLCLDDMGKHIYVTNDYTKIAVPYHESDPLPIGYTVVIINDSGNSISIDTDGGGIEIKVPGVDSSQYWDLDSPGMATLIKVSEYTWFMTGNVQVD